MHEEVESEVFPLQRLYCAVELYYVRVELSRRRTIALVVYLLIPSHSAPASFTRWRVAKRPGLDAFLKEMSQLYEIVVFTDSSGMLADEVTPR